MELMLIVLKGRKTAALLEIAQQQANQRNIFFVRANGATSLHQAYLHIAKCVGPEYLLREFRGVRLGTQGQTLVFISIKNYSVLSFKLLIARLIKGRLIKALVP